MATNMGYLMCIITLHNLASVIIRNISKIYNRVMVAKAFTGCYGEILLAMDTYMLSKDVDNRSPQITISYYSKYVEN